MFDKPMIRYNHPGDLNTWFVQLKEDRLPVWAVNVEDYVYIPVEVDDE